MPYVEVWVDTAELNHFSDEELRAELARRAIKKNSGSSLADHRIPEKVAETTLDDASQVLRKMGRVDLAFKLDEIRVDYLQ